MRRYSSASAAVISAADGDAGSLALRLRQDREAVHLAQLELAVPPEPLCVLGGGVRIETLPRLPHAYHTYIQHCSEYVRLARPVRRRDAHPHLLLSRARERVEYRAGGERRGVVLL